jgi:5-hydroxyisourate hydrolase
MAQGRLTTHVLDTATGRPASGVVIALSRINGESVEFLKTVTTNADGRVDGPILENEDITTGTYELVFHVGEYLDALSNSKVKNRFLDLVPIRFGIDDVGQHFHVPLLISPFGYSTYRGS